MTPDALLIVIQFGSHCEVRDPVLFTLTKTPVLEGAGGALYEPKQF